METTETIKSIGYVRTSTNATDRQTLKTQRADIKRFCEYNKRELVEIFEDNAYSGDDENRPQFQKALRMLERGEAKELVVQDLSRFSRNTSYALKVVQNMKGWGAMLASTYEKIDFDSMAGEIVFTLFITFAKWQLKIQRQKSIDNRLMLFEQKRLTQGIAKYGYNYDKKTGEFPTDKIKSEIVKQVFECFNEKRMKPEEISRELKIAPSKVNRILRTETYYSGKHRLTFQGMVDFKKVDPIIEKKTFDKAKRLREANVAKGKSDGKDFILRDTIFCDICGGKMFWRSQGKYEYYEHHCNDIGGKKSLRKNEIENGVWESIMAEIGDRKKWEARIMDTKKVAMEAKAKLEKDRETAINEREKAQNDADFWWDKMPGAKNDKEQEAFRNRANKHTKRFSDFDTEITEIEKQIEEVERIEKITIDGYAGKAILSLSAEFKKEKSLKEKRQFIEWFCKSIKYDWKTKTGTINGEIYFHKAGIPFVVNGHAT